MTVNWLAVLVAGVVAMVVGYLWYGPFFGKAWLRLSGVNEQEAKAGAGKAYPQMFVGSLLTAFVLAVVITNLGLNTFGEGMVFAFWVWLGFIVPILFGGVLFEKKPSHLFLFNIGYQLVVMLINGGILAVWMK